MGSDQCNRFNKDSLKLICQRASIWELGTCVCPHGTYGALGSSTCKNETVIGTFCNNTIDTFLCQSAINDSQCLDGRCQCMLGFYGKEAGKTCTNTQVVGLGCQNETDCSKVSNTICENDKCSCQRGYYAEEGEPSCKEEIKKDLEQHCDGDGEQECRTLNASCMAGICSCLVGFYKHKPNITKPWTCLPKSLVGQNCTSEHGFDVCNDTNAACNGGVCTCNSGFARREDICVSKVDFTQSCQSTEECLDIDAVCINNTCDCKNGTYLVSGRYLYCRPLVNLNKPCPSNRQGVCKDPNAVCSGGRCICKPSFYSKDGNVCGKFQVVSFTFILSHIMFPFIIFLITRITKTTKGGGVDTLCFCYDCCFG
ncbi:platelet endothelial aggregation receptor 1-like [Lingula anatina]|uniref:Platelet endothelial aggregation receptor 1-like n=1 Tax=Lingula anatina TaxID=7574 RepID=A0A1S3HKL4_LINAN|nr:platelet endothelial aggregation receptor 1-like [Lingula anatina]|eukprot:XP_013386650.1 platelet endothelial aggregation receptor 1-like [Lingula anatina]